MPMPLSRARNVIFSVALLTLMTGCQRPPTAAVSASIHYIVIEDGVSDTNLRTYVGEEVRWVNVRPEPVTVIFSGLMRDGLSCERGFSKDDAEHMTAVILPKNHASLCFSTTGRLTYRVLNMDRFGVELNHEATVQVLATR